MCLVAVFFGWHIIISLLMTNNTAPKKLYRSRDERLIAGVCGGLGGYFSLDPVIFRIAFVLSILASGIGILVYIILWLIIPEGDSGYMYTDTTYTAPSASNDPKDDSTNETH